MSLAALRRIMPPPASPSLGDKLPDWLAIEKQLCPLPAEYKAFIETYGLGKIDDFLILYSPHATDRYLNLLTRGPIDLDALRELKTKHGDREVPYPLFPDPNGLLPFGIDENGDGLYWLMEGTPDQWPVVVNEGRAPEYQTFNVPLTDFLTGILTKTLRCRIFPNDFPSPEPRFTPLP
jgi:hypothetical protein